MSETRGVFGIFDTVNSKLDDQWVSLDDVWISVGISTTRFSDGAGPTPHTGYFGGGSPGPRTTMDKVTYSSDTTAAVPGAALSVARNELAATGSSTSGYFGGGLVSPNPRSTMDKVTYASDTTAQVPGAALSVARYGPAASSIRANALPNLDPPAATPTPQTAFAPAPTPNTGYFGGGIDYSPATARRSTMDKVTYSNDTTAQIPGASLSGVRYFLAATGNSTAGYFGGGNIAPGAGFATATMDKVTYSSDTTAAVPGANLSVARYGLAATGNSDAGYFGGGQPSSAPSGRISTMDKVTYSNDTTAAVPGAPLSDVRFQLAATGSSTAGYFGGGFSNSGAVSIMDKVTYSSDTTAAVPGAFLSGVRYRPAASSIRANALPIINPPAATPTPQTYNGSPINV